MPMQHLLTPDGDAALAVLMQGRPLLAFDFDGTLAPIVPRPEDARISQAVASRLRELARRLPVAIVTGRTASDVRARLGFEPGCVVGSHGAEDGRDPATIAAHAQALDPLRERLRVHHQALVNAGVRVEDKGLSLALHYRLARIPDQAVALIEQLLTPVPSGLRVFGGKMVVNAMAADAPDKADAVLALVAGSGADSALFVGDDVNDEPVFAAAPLHWLTVRVGRDDPSSRARFFLDSSNEVAMLLERLLALAPRTGA